MRLPTWHAGPRCQPSRQMAEGPALPGPKSGRQRAHSSELIRAAVRRVSTMRANALILLPDSEEAAGRSRKRAQGRAPIAGPNGPRRLLWGWRRRQRRKVWLRRRCHHASSKRLAKKAAEAGRWQRRAITCRGLRAITPLHDTGRVTDTRRLCTDVLRQLGLGVRLQKRRHQRGVDIGSPAPPVWGPNATIKAQTTRQVLVAFRRFAAAAPAGPGSSGRVLGARSRIRINMTKSRGILPMPGLLLLFPGRPSGRDCGVSRSICSQHFARCL